MSAAFPVLYALLFVAGAVTAWRHHPLYSGRQTFRFLIVVVPAIAVVLAVIAAAGDLTRNSPPAVVGGAMAAVVVFGALSLIFIIQAASTPKAARLQTALPPTAPRVAVHRHAVYRWARWVAVLLAACALLGILLPGNARFAALALGGVLLLLAAVLLPVMYVSARNFDRSLSALEWSPWIHWTYPPADWTSWIAVQVERARAVPPPVVWRRDWRKLGGVLAAIAAGIALFSPGSWLEKGLYALCCCTALSMVVVWSVRAGRRGPERLRAALQRAAAETYFGHDGLYCNGVYRTWLGLDVYLTAATVDSRPPRSLEFRFEKVVPNPYAGNQIIPIVQSVLIPAGAAADIARLQTELLARCPKAQIRLA